MTKHGSKRPAPPADDCVEYVPRPFDFSRGRGESWDPVGNPGSVACPECGGVGHVACPECKGTGERRGEYCRACEGAGGSGCDHCDGGVVPACPAGPLAYPLPADFVPPDDPRSSSSGLVRTMIVREGGAFLLAPTHDGAGVEWDVCESYLSLGYLPPAWCCARLRPLRGRLQTAGGRRVAARCRRCLTLRAGRAARALVAFDRRFGRRRPDA